MVQDFAPFATHQDTLLKYAIGSMDFLLTCREIPILLFTMYQQLMGVNSMKFNFTESHRDIKVASPSIT